MIKRTTKLAAVLLMALLPACSAPQVRCTSPEDNPQHHYVRGMEALEAGKIAVAEDKLGRALYCNDSFSPAHSGAAIVSAAKAKVEKDTAFRGVQVGRSEDSLGMARKHAEEAPDYFDLYLSRLRSATLIKRNGWLQEAEDASRQAAKLNLQDSQLLYYQGKEAAAYFMGIAYLEALEFQMARDRFSEVLGSIRDGKWHEKADRSWKKTDRILRAMAGLTVGDVGKKIAVQDSVTRADLAALLVDEMRVEKLFAGRIPAASQLAAMKAEFTPADVLDSPFREEIETVMKWKVRGLEPKFDQGTKAYLFKPADPVSRGEMALILEDVLMKLTGDERLATAYFGQEKSPFPDVRPTSPFYNAALNMTTRGIMEAELSGEFRLNDVVDGAEALLALRVLKQKMNIH